MKIIYPCLPLILLLNLMAFVICGGQPNSKETSSVSESLRTSKIRRLEIIYYPENILTRVQLTPEMLENQHQYKLIVNDVRSSVVGKEVMTAIEGENFTASEQQADFRWGCSFYGDKNERIASLYFDNSGKVAMVGTVSMASSGHVVKCFKKICAGFRD